MLTRQIPSSGHQLPVIGLGTYVSFNVSLESVEVKNLQNVLSLFFDAGGSLIDFSPMYGNSEEVVGTLLKQSAIQNKAFIAAKVWTIGRHSGIEEMNKSLCKLKSDPIDLMQVHNLIDCETHLCTLNEWKQAERIKYIGITHFASSGFCELMSFIKRHRCIDFCQFPYSIATHREHEYFLDFCADYGIATIINRPLEQGALFTKLKYAALPSWAHEIDCDSFGQFFLKYLLSFEAVTCVIPATSNLKHMHDNLQAGEGRLPDKQQRMKMYQYFKDN